MGVGLGRGRKEMMDDARVMQLSFAIVVWIGCRGSLNRRETADKVLGLVPSIRVSGARGGVR
ncbi:hypothetical protein Hanom_Chr09g00821451 [Helianthus anomalus]